MTIENAYAGSSKITLIHHGGDTIVNAFKGNPPYWNYLEVRINGAVFSDILTLNGATVSSGDFKPGDELELSLDSGLNSDDSISVVYTPTGDLLQRATVS